MVFPLDRILTYNLPCMIFGHGFVGSAVTYSIIKKKKKNYSKLEYNLLWIAGITASMFPDFDLLSYLFSREVNHRLMLSHSLVPYIYSFLILLFLILIITKKHTHDRKFSMLLMSVIFINIFIHLVIDVFLGGTVFFAPITYKIVGFEIMFYKAQTWIFQYITSPYGLFELASFLLYLYVFIKEKNFYVRTLPFLICLTAVVASYILYII